VSRLKSNILANFFGKGWASVLALVFTPVYIASLGIESYGFVGIYVAAQAILAAFDFGLSTALNREIARFHHAAGKEQQLRNLTRTLEAVYWSGGLAIGVIGTIAAPWIANHWIGTSSLPDEVVSNAILLMAWGLAFQWPYALYAGGLNGLQRQVLLNQVLTITATLRWGGAALVVLLLSQTIEAFFLWQLTASLITTLVSGRLLWRELGASGAWSRVDPSLLYGIRKFAWGVGGASVLGIVLTQLDKIILSKLLPLQQFAYYSLAAMLAAAVYMAVSPVISAIFPRFAELAANNNEAGIFQVFHKSSQLVALLAFPLAWTLGVFADDVILLWTRNPDLAQQSGWLLQLIVAGTMLNALMHVPHALLLGRGFAHFWLYVNVISVVLLVPMIIVLTENFGAAGAPVAWIALNSGYLLIAAPLMPIPKRELYRWYRDDVVIPMVASGMAILFVAWLRPVSLQGFFEMAFWIALALVVGLVAVFTATWRRGGLVGPAAQSIK